MLETASILNTYEGVVHFLLSDASVDFCSVLLSLWNTHRNNYYDSDDPSLYIDHFYKMKPTKKKKNNKHVFLIKTPRLWFLFELWNWMRFSLSTSLQEFPRVQSSAQSFSSCTQNYCVLLYSFICLHLWISLPGWRPSKGTSTPISQFAKSKSECNWFFWFVCTMYTIKEIHLNTIFHKTISFIGHKYSDGKR